MSELTNTVTINKKDFFIEQDEFSEIKHETFSNLRILKDVGKYERIMGLLQELTKVKPTNTNTHTLLCINVTHGGFLAINSSNYFKEIYGICNGENHYKNATKNIEKISIKAIKTLCSKYDIFFHCSVTSVLISITLSTT